MLLPADRDGGDVVEPAGRRDRGLERVPPGLGGDLGALGVGRVTGADDRAGLGVADDDLAGLGGGVDPRDEWHVQTLRLSVVRAAAGLPLPLSHGPYAAEIVTVGACLRTLTRDGVDLVAGSEPGEMCREHPRGRADAVAQPGRRRRLRLRRPALPARRSASRPSTTPSTGSPTGSPGRSPSTPTDRVVLTYELAAADRLPVRARPRGRLPARRRRPDHDAVGDQRRAPTPRRTAPACTPT